MDVLSTILKTLKLEGAMFYNAEFSAPLIRRRGAFARRPPILSQGLKLVRMSGVRDPDVGNALALVHRQPSNPWTIAELARRGGASRSVLAERFRNFLGVPPMADLTRWRLQLGAQLLTSTSHSVAQISGEVGYESGRRSTAPSSTNLAHRPRAFV